MQGQCLNVYSAIWMLENEKLGGTGTGMLFDICKRSEGARSGSAGGSPNSLGTKVILGVHSQYSES